MQLHTDTAPKKRLRLKDAHLNEGAAAALYFISGLLIYEGHLMEELRVLRKASVQHTSAIAIRSKKLRRLRTSIGQCLLIAAQRDNLHSLAIIQELQATYPADGIPQKPQAIA